MRRLILTGIAMAGLFALVSCKKDYTCRCVITTGSNSFTTDRTITMKKKDATETCEAQNSSEVIQGINTTTKCSLQ